jgi:hypothetical protein
MVVLLPLPAGGKGAGEGSQASRPPPHARGGGWVNIRPIAGRDASFPFPPLT